MSKEKLKFKFEGKTIVYDGRPENRVKDLMDILAKLNANPSAAITAFRENVDGEANYTDEAIQGQFKEAQAAYAQKKKRKSSTSGLPEPESASSPPAEEAEKMQKITLSFNGKQFSYEGLPSGKQRAVIELLVKQSDLTPELAASTFHKNLPTSTLKSDEIWKLITELKETKAARKAAKKEAVGHENNSSHSKPQTGQNGRPHKESSPSGTGGFAIDEISGMTTAERDSISNFIKQVLDQPDAELGTRLRDDSASYMGRGASHTVSSMDDEVPLSATRTLRGKFTIYCQEEKSTAVKALCISATTTFEEFSNMVEKKYGTKMVTSFFEGDDVVDMDDDDTFCMFIEMSQALAHDGKRVKVICAPPESRKKAVEDKLTDGKGILGNREKAFSSGMLLVKEEKTYTSHTSAVYCCSFSSKGDRFCTASRDRSVRLWNTATGSCSVMKGGHNGFVLSCDFSPRGNRVVSSSDDRTIKIWNTTTCAKVFTLKGHDDKVYCVQYNSTGDYIASASCDHTLRVWNGDSGAKMVTLRGHTLAVFSCCFSNTDGGKLIVSGGDDRLIKVWDWVKSEEVRSFPGHTDTVWSCKFSHDDTRVVSATMNHELRVWDWRNSVCTLNLNGHLVPIHHAIFSPNDKYIISCSRDWTVMVWDATTGDHMETITGHNSTVYHLDMHGNKLLTSSLDDNLKLWSITELK